jgi:hypothetical protein
MGRIHPLPLPHLVEATQMFLLYKSVEENMTAKMKSRITERQEKGLGPISFKRLLMAGGAGVMSAMILIKIIGFFPGCAGAVFLTVTVVILTHPIEGLALNMFLLRSARGMAAVSALNLAGKNLEPGPLSQALQVGPEDATFHADAIYEVEWEDEVDDLPPQTLIYRGGFAGLGRAGLAVVDNPFFGSGNGHTADKE